MTGCDRLPHEFGHKDLVCMFKAAVGKSPASFRANTTIPVMDIYPGEADHSVSLVRGVVLNLDLQMRLISIEVTPSKVREYSEIMKIAEISHDIASDVSVRHDDYLANSLA